MYSLKQQKRNDRNNSLTSSDWIWWIVFVIGYFLIFSLIFIRFLGLQDLGHELRWGGVVSAFSDHFVILLNASLLSFLATLPSLFPRHKKYLIVGYILAINSFLFYLLVFSSESERLGQIGPFAPLLLFILFCYYLVVLAIFVSPPIIIQRVKIQGSASKTIALLFIGIEVISAIVLSYFIVSSSRTMAQLAQIQEPPLNSNEVNLCVKAEQRIRFARIWRDVYTENCPLETRDHVLFSSISDNDLGTYAETCQIGYVFSSSTDLNGICLSDRSGFLTSSEDFMSSVLRTAKFERECKFEEYFDVHEEKMIKRMEKVCIPTN